MASPSMHAMPEHWTELSAARRQRQLCSDRIRALRSACDQACVQKPAIDCPSCYGKALEQMRLRYTDSRDREWFTQRKAFLHELEGLFQDAKDGKRSLDFVEARIESEKEAWYRWVLRKYPEFIAVSDHGANQGELRAMLDDTDRSRQELVGMMLAGIGTPADWPSSVDALADKAAVSKDDAAELKKLYIAWFFTTHASHQVVQHAAKYLQYYTDSESASLEDMIDRIAMDMKESRSSQPQRDYHQGRLDELRRAKTAFEHDKAQAKSRASGNQASAASEKLRNLPPCYVCQGAVDPSAILSCSLCQVVTQMGGAYKLTVYCSDDCFRKGHGEHVAVEHQCQAGEKCVQVRDEGLAMGDEASKPISCKDCWNQKLLTLFCSEECARENAAEHRQSSHGAEMTGEEAANAMASTQQMVEAALARENPGLIMTRVE